MITTKTPTTIDERIVTLAEKTKAQLVAAVIDLEHRLAEIGAQPSSPPVDKLIIERNLLRLERDELKKAAEDSRKAWVLRDERDRRRELRLDIDTVGQKARQWQDRNFDDMTPVDGALALCEEAGEVACSRTPCFVFSTARATSPASSQRARAPSTGVMSSKFLSCHRRASAPTVSMSRRSSRRRSLSSLRTHA